MTVNKINGFAAPYRSDTFRKTVDKQTARSGVLSMAGEVTQSGPTITVPALTFVQNGLIVEKTSTTTLSAPTMEAPYHLVVSAPSNALTDDLIWSFAKSPLDFTATQVLIASYDGLEWREPGRLSIDGIYDELNQANIDFDKVGPFSGLVTTVDGSDYKNSAGVVVDKQGLRQALAAEAAFPVLADETDWSRVDRVIYRRPADSEHRLGVRQFIKGGAFAASPATLYDTAGLDDALGRVKTKVLIGSDNTAHMFASSGSGDSYELRYVKIAADRQSLLVAETTLVSMTEPCFDVAIDSADSLYVTYVDNGDIKWRKFSSVGASITGAVQVDTQGTASTNPRIAIDPYSARSYVVYQNLVAANNNQIFFATLELGGITATASKRLTNNGSNLELPSLTVTDDFLVYVAWQNSSTGAVLVQVFDDIGTAVGSATTVSGATTRVGFGSVTGAAKAPRVFVTDNKVPGVAFLQDKGGDVWGVTVWMAGAGTMVDLSGASEDIEAFDLFVEPIFNLPLILFATATEVWAAKVKDGAVAFSQQLAATGAQDVSTARDQLGAMLHAWTTPAALTYTVYLASQTVFYLGSQVVTGSINNATLAPGEFMISSSVVETPVIGDHVTIAGSSTPGNNGTFEVLGVRLHSLNGLDDRLIIEVDTSFPVSESPSLGTNASFERLDGNEARFIKATAELQAQAYSLDELDTDVLLARIVTPGPIILNYPGAGAGGGGVVAFDQLLPYGPSVAIDWESTTLGELTIAGGLKILDLLNNFTYTLTDGGYALTEGQALYVELDGSDFSPTPQVALVQNLPFGLPIQVLGAIKDGEFHPHLLAQGGMTQLDSGEAVVYGEDLPAPVRAKLGIANDTAMVPYPFAFGLPSGLSTSYPLAIGHTNIMAAQNKHIRLVRGQVTWANPNAGELVVTADLYLQVPGVAESTNRIAPQTIALAADGDVAVVEVNRVAGAPAALTVTVGQVSALALTRNSMILARRVGADVILEANGARLTAGSTYDLGRTLSVENRTYLGLTGDEKTGGVFTTALGGPTRNVHVADGDTLEQALKKLDRRNDTVPRVRAIDITSTVLPSGATATVDGLSIADGDWVLFADPAINGVYSASGIGTAVVWTLELVFGGSGAPADSSMVRVEDGTTYLSTLWLYDSADGWRPMETLSLAKEATGFPSRADSVLSFDDGTRTFEIAPWGTHFDIFMKGKPYRFSAPQTAQIPDQAGVHYFYFDGATLQTTDTYTDDLLQVYALAAAIYWDMTGQKAIMLMDLRHGIATDGDTHRNLQHTVGVRLVEGLELTNFTDSGTGNSNSHAQVGLTDGVIINEDLTYEIKHAATPSADFEQVLDPAAEIPVVYKDGANGEWTKDGATAFPLKAGISVPQYNRLDSGIWITQEATDGYYLSMWLFATPSIETPVVAILGQRQSPSFSDARLFDTYEGLNLDGLPVREMRVLYRLVFQAVSTATNTIKARLRGVLDLRTAADPLAENEIDALEARAEAAETAIGALQVALAAIQANNPAEETQTVGAGGTTVINASTFTWDPDNTVYDIEVYINGRRYLQDTSGTNARSFKKTDDNSLLFTFTIPENAEVTIWKQGTSSGGGGGGGGGSDLTAIAVDPRPATPAGQALGTLAKPWSGLYIKDTVTAQVYRLEVNNGFFEVTEVP